jgi:hypothetical protein
MSAQWKEFWANSTPADPLTVTISPDTNDFLIGSAITDTSSASDLDSTPAEWTQQYRGTVTTDNQVHQVIYKKASGSETSVSFDSSSGNPAIGYVASYSGVDINTPFDVTPQTFTSSTSSTTTDISITPITDGCILAFCQGQDNGNSDYSFTFSTESGSTGSWTTQVDQNSGFYNQGHGSASQTTAGAVTARCTSTSGGRSGILFALRPAPTTPKNRQKSFCAELLDVQDAGDPFTTELLGTGWWRLGWI